MAVDYSAFNTLAKYWGKVHSEYDRVNLVRDWMFDVRDLRNANESVIHVIQNRVATEFAPGTSRWSESNTVERKVSLTHNYSVETVEKLPWEQTLKLPWNMQAKYAGKLAQNAQSGLMKRVCAFLIGNTPDGSNNNDSLDHVIEKDLSGTSLATRVRDFIIEANDALSGQDIPAAPGDRIMWMKPTAFSQLWTLPEVVRKDFGGAGGVRQFNYMGLPMGGITKGIEYANWIILETNGSFDLDFSTGTGNVASAHGLGSDTPDKFRIDCTDFFAVGWHRECVALGYATDGENHVQVDAPVYSSEFVSWFFRTAMILDIQSIIKATPLTDTLDAWTAAPGKGLVALKHVASS